jgi:hypothetical protein
MNVLQELKYVHDNCSHSINSFFSHASCYGKKNCRKEYSGDEGALKCLHEFGDVAFISIDSYRKLNGEFHIHLQFKSINQTHFFSNERQPSCDLPRKI